MALNSKPPSGFGPSFKYGKKKRLNLIQQELKSRRIPIAFTEILLYHYNINGIFHNNYLRTNLIKSERFQISVRQEFGVLP